MGTLALSGACLIKAGTNVSSDFKDLLAETAWEPLILQAESFVNSTSREDWTASYSGLSANKKYILEDLTSNIAAIYAISYDMSGYTTRIEAEDMINILWARNRQLITTLEDQKVVTFINGA